MLYGIWRAAAGDVHMTVDLERAIGRRLTDFNPQGLANSAWAFATAGQNDASLFAALATATEQHMGGFIPQDFANTVWAIATLS